MKTILTFPPVWESSTPYSSLAVLSAYLKRHNIDVDICDLNIESQYYMLTDQQFLQNIIKTLKQQYQEAIEPNHRDTIELSLKLYEQFREIMTDNIVLKVQLSENQAAEMKYKLICNYIRYIVSAPFYPSCFSDLSYKSRVELNTIENLFSQVDCAEENIFFGVFKKKFFDQFVNYDIVGISIASVNQLVPAFTLAKILKAAKHEIKIIVGGAILPYLEEYIRNNQRFFEYVDYYIVGEGETALYKCIQFIEGEVPLECIPNTLYFVHGHTISNEMNHVEDVNDLPVPDYSQYPFDKYITRKIGIPYLASRGCHWNKCSFCSLTCNYGNKYRQSTYEKMQSDILTLVKQYKFDRLAFNDEALTAKRISDVSDIFIYNQLNIKWNCLARLSNNYSQELIEKAKRSGLLMLSLGLESGSQNTLDAMRKGIKINHVPKIIQEFRKYGIWVNLYYIIGFPTETKEDFKESLQFIANNLDNIDSLCYTIFRLEANSDVYINPEKYNVTKIPLKKSKDFFGPEYAFETFTYRAEDINRRYNELYNLIDTEKCNPTNIYYDFDSVFSFLCENKQEELNYAINQNVLLKRQIVNLIDSDFNSIEFVLNENALIIRCENTYVILENEHYEMYTFNQTAIYMLQLIEKGKNTFNQIINEMLLEYNLKDNINLLKRDVQAILGKMIYLGIINYRSVR